jgi:hypothetical protein
MICREPQVNPYFGTSLKITSSSKISRKTRRIIAQHTLRDHALAPAHRVKRPYFTPEGRDNKEERARKIMERDAITDGLVAVFSTMGKSPSFKMVPGKGRPRLKRDQIPQICLYCLFSCVIRLC